MIIKKLQNNFVQKFKTFLELSCAVPQLFYHSEIDEIDQFDSIQSYDMVLFIIALLLPF